MKRLTQVRTELGISKAKLAQKADLNPGTIVLAESGRMIPYPKQLEKIAAALGWEGDPNDLLKEIQ